jgi:hypothetical protein
MKRYFLLLSFLFLACPAMMAEGETDPAAKRFTLSGHVKDSQTGEDLIGATIYVIQTASGTVTNPYGFYSLSLVKGEYTLRYSYIGYQSVQRDINVENDLVFDIELLPGQAELSEIEIIASRSDENVKAPETGVVKMDVKTISSIPALMGEVDLIKAIQLLPGVQAVAEGSSGFSVRGGSPDQNLVLLDEATVYNPSHFLGFFSVFNNDAIKEVKLYKGDLPAQYGGRLASVLDVRMRDGNAKRFSGTGGIGLISSRLTLEGPIIKDMTSFLVSGRRTYADLFLPLAREEAARDSRLYFYDFNAKVNHTFNENNRIYLSGYFGRDIFKNPFAYMKLGNSTGTFRWNHLFSQKLFSNLSLVYSHYNYNLGTSEEDEANSFIWTSNLRDIKLTYDFSLYLNDQNTLRFGASSIYHTFEPGKAKGLGEESLFTEYEIDRNYSLESGIYISNDQNIGTRLILRYGLRISLFQNLGPGTVYFYDDEWEVADSAEYSAGKVYQTYAGIEPRIAMSFMLNERSSLKASFSHTYQYIQLAQNSTAGTPLDIWFSASPNVRPQVADQVAAGYFRNFRRNTVEASAEVYYKWMSNSIDFKDHAELLLNKYLEGEIRFGKSWSYGLELMVRKSGGKLNGWVSYTYSRALREIKEINDGDPYPAAYDSPHDVSIVANYDLSKRISFSANWLYSTGKPVTFPTGRAVVEGVIMPIYSDRNAYRMEDYHRLDLSMTLRQKPKDKQFKWELVFSTYNTYNRKNAWAINFVQDPGDPLTTYAEKTYLFGIIPSITFNFRF